MEHHIEATIRSVVGQQYPNLEYIVIDGASTDRTPAILKKYANCIDVLVSEPDDGQYHAIQKGMGHATGDIMAWLNADDIYMPWTLSIVSEVFEKFPDVDWIIGLPSFLNEKGQCVSIHSNVAAYPQHYIRNGWYRGHLAGYLQQESMFWRRSLWEKAGGLDLSLDMASDFKLWSVFAQHSELVPISVPLAAFRRRPGEQKSSANREAYDQEVMNICSELPTPPALWDKVARQGVAARSFCRSLIWKQTRVIAYSEVAHEWKKIPLVRPVSRVSFGHLLLEQVIRR